MSYDIKEVLFHYTTGNVFKRILKQESIIPDRSEPNNDGEIATVTFSSNPIWENSRYRVGKLPTGKLVLMSKELLRKFDGGLYRIVVPKTVAPLDWVDMKDKCGMSRDCIRAIYDFGIEVGARTSQWFGTLESVPENVWITVEKLNDKDEWVELTEDDIPEPSDEDAPLVEIPEDAIIGDEKSL